MIKFKKWLVLDFKVPNIHIKVSMAKSCYDLRELSHKILSKVFIVTVE